MSKLLRGITAESQELMYILVSVFFLKKALNMYLKLEICAVYRKFFGLWIRIYRFLQNKSDDYLF